MKKALQALRPIIAKGVEWASIAIVVVDALNALLSVVDNHGGNDKDEEVTDAVVVEEK